MNTAILHGARPGDRSTAKTGSMGFKKAAAMAKRMGIDLTALGAQGDSFWAMLEDLSKNDPQGYEEFIQQQFEEAKRAQSGTRGFRPQPGFVVKMALARKHASGLKITARSGPRPGDVLYVNVCGFEGCEAPRTKTGEAVVDTVIERPTADALQIPLIVGKMRSKGDEDRGVCHFVDVVFNPWVVKQSLQHTFFLAQVVDLARHWVEQEVGVSLDKQWKRLEGGAQCKAYVGGEGKGGVDPLFFAVDEVIDQERPPEEREAAARERAAAQQQDSRTPPKPISDPQSVLKQMRRQERQQQEESGGSVVVDPSDLLRSEAHVKEVGGRPLVEEVGGSKEEDEEEEESEGGAGPESGPSGAAKDERREVEKRRKPLIKKGFLHSPEATSQLYPEGRSNEGAPAGLYSKCKIVDTTTMSQEEVEAAMKQHAGVGDQPATKPRQAKPHAAVASKPSPAPPVLPDEDFERLVEALDPENSRSNRYVEEEDEALQELSRLASALGSMPTPSTVFKDTAPPPSASTNPTAPPTDSAEQPSAPRVPHQLSWGEGQVTVSMDLSGLDPGLTAADLLLDVGEGKLCLSAPGGVREEVSLSGGSGGSRVVEGSARAAFKRKARRFIVTLDLHKP